MHDVPVVSFSGRVSRVLSYRSSIDIVSLSAFSLDTIRNVLRLHIVFKTLVSASVRQVSLTRGKVCEVPTCYPQTIASLIVLIVLTTQLPQLATSSLPSTSGIISSCMIRYVYPLLSCSFITSSRSAHEGSRGVGRYCVHVQRGQRSLVWVRRSVGMPCSPLLDGPNVRSLHTGYCMDLFSGVEGCPRSDGTVSSVP